MEPSSSAGAGERRDSGDDAVFDMEESRPGNNARIGNGDFMMTISCYTC
jgi:hypothetical protein